MIRRETLANGFRAVTLPPDVYPMPVVGIAWHQSVEVRRLTCIRRNHSRRVFDGLAPVGWVKCRPEQDPR